jgi:LysR family transcriptional regulator for bpeEF and oprC
VEEQTRGLDVMLLLGWQPAGDLVQRRLGATSFVVCAAPSYWQQHGMPQHPSELAQHNCLCVRTAFGAVMDLWRFRRGDEEVEVTARGSMVFDNVHRDMARDLIVAGVGVGRILEWDTRRGALLGGGTLVPALTDWENLEVPPVNLLYPPSVRRVPRVRVFIEFVTQLFQDLETMRQHRLPATGQPEWTRRHRARASSAWNGGAT